MAQKSLKLSVCLKRLCAFFVIICFVVSDLRAYADTAPLSLGAQTSSSLAPDIRGWTQKIIPPSLPESFVLPPELGTVKNIYRGSNPQTVLLIQDAHSQLEAQNSIQSILKYAEETYGFKLLFLEGGLEGPISQDLLRFYQNDAVNERIAETLLQKARVTGPGVFLLKHPGTLRAYGVEKASRYFGNIESYRRVIGAKEKSDAFLKQIKLRLAPAASNTFNPDLLSFSKEWLFYKDSHQDLLIHLEVLKRAAEKYLAIHLEDGRNQLEYPQLVRYFKLREIEKAIRLTAVREKSGKEKDELLDWTRRAPLKQPLTDFLKLITLAGQSNSGEELPQSPRHVLESFFEEARPLGFHWERYPNLNLFFSQMILSREIQAEDLFEEVEGVTSGILKKLTRNTEEKKLLKLYRRYEILNKLFSLELSRAEFLKLQQAGTLLRPEQLAGHLKAITVMPFSPAADFGRLDKIYEDAVRFYEIARGREDGMMTAVRGVLGESGGDKAVLVAGGFHSEGLEEKMRDEKISYISILPKISHLSADQNYIDQMMLIDRDDPRHSQVVQIGPDRIAIPQMPARDGAFIAAEIETVKAQATQGLGVLSPGPAADLHSESFLPKESDRAEMRSPSERNLFDKGLGLGKVQVFVGESLENQKAGRTGMDYVRELTPSKLARLAAGKRTDTIRYRASEEQALHNLIKNALDANVSKEGRPVSPEKKSRYHGEGALGFLAELVEPEDYAVLESKTENGKGFRVTFWNRGTQESPLYQFYFEEIENMKGRGTRITVYKTLDNWQQRWQAIAGRLSVNTSAPLFVNKEQVNHPDQFDVLNPRDGKVDTRMNPVQVTIARDGYRVTDFGTGMTAKEFFENFLFPGIPEEETAALQKARKRRPEETRVYASRDSARETRTESWLNGHRVKVFPHAGPKRLNLVSRLILDFPPGTPHSNSGDSLTLDVRAQEGLRSAIDRLTDPDAPVENRFAQINSLAVYLRAVQPEAERSRLGKRALLAYLIEKMKGPSGLIAALKERGDLVGRILVPNTLSVPDTQNGWAAFDHSKFIPLDEELFDFKFSDLKGALGKLTRQERESLVGKNEVLNTVPIYVASWPFKDKLRGMPVTWILDDNGHPALLVDADALRSQRPNLAMIAGGLDFLAETQLREILRKKGIRLKEVSIQKEKKEKRGFFSWLYSWRKWVIAAVAFSLFGIAPAVQFVRWFGSREEVPKNNSRPAVTVSQQEEQTAIAIRTIVEPVKPKLTPKQEMVTKPNAPARPAIHIPPTWIPPQNGNQEVRPPAIPGTQLRLPATTEGPPANGQRREIAKKSESPFQKQNRSGKIARSGPISSLPRLNVNRGQGGGEDQNQTEESPVYGYVENAVSANGVYETLSTGDIYPAMDDRGDWVPQKERLKTVKKGAVPVNAQPIRVNLWGDVTPGYFPLYNYHTGIIRNIRVILINRETNQVDEKATEDFQKQWRREKEHLMFSAANPPGTFVRIEYDIDYYKPQDLEGYVSPSVLSQKEKEDFEKYFGSFFQGTKGKTDAEKLQALADFVHKVMVYDLYATPRQGALTIDQYDSWSAALADILTRGVDPNLSPQEAIRQGLEAGNQGKVICNNVCPITAAAADYLGIPFAFRPVQRPDSNAELTQEKMAHAEMLVGMDSVYVVFDPTKVLNYQESSAEANQPGEVGAGGIVKNGAEAVQRRAQAYQQFLDHFKTLETEGVISKEEAQTAWAILSALQAEKPANAELGSKFLDMLDKLSQDPAHRKKTRELSEALAKAAYPYRVFLSDMTVKSIEEQFNQQRQHRQEAVRLTKGLLRDAQLDGFLEEKEYEEVMDILDEILDGNRTTARQRNQVIRALTNAAKDARIAGSLEDAFEKLRFHFWQISMAYELKYLEDLQTVLETLHRKGTLTDSEHGVLSSLVDRFWESRHDLSEKDFDTLSDWLDFLAQDPEYGDAVKTQIENLKKDYDFRRSQQTRQVRKIETELKTLQGAQNSKDEDIEKLLELIERSRKERIDFETQDELFRTARMLQNRYPEKAVFFSFAMEVFHDQRIGLGHGWHDFLEPKDEDYLAQRLAEVLEGVVPEADVRDFAARKIREDAAEKKGLGNLLYVFEQFKEAKEKIENEGGEVSSLKEKFETEKKTLERDEKSKQELEQIKKSAEWWSFWGSWIVSALILGGIFLIAVIGLWEGVRDEIERERRARRKSNPYPGHTPEVEASLPGPRSEENHPEESVPYAKVENPPFSEEFLILSHSSQLDETGRWKTDNPIRKKTRQGAAKKVNTTARVFLMKQKVTAGGQISLPVFNKGMVSSVKITAVDEDGRKVPQSSQRASRQGDRIIFEADGWVEIRYEIDYYEPKDFQMASIETVLPENEKRDLKKYFGSGKYGFGLFQALSWREKIAKINQFLWKHVILDLSVVQGDEKAFRREAHHTSWAHAFYEHFQKYGAVRMNFSTAVLIKFLLLSYLGLPAVRLKRVTTKPLRGTRPWTMDTGMDEIEGLLVGIPVDSQNRKNAETDADEIIERGNYGDLEPVGKGLLADGKTVGVVWYSDRSFEGFQDTFDPPWNEDSPKKYEVFLGVIVRRIKPFLIWISSGTVRVVLRITVGTARFIPKMLKAIFWPFPWMKEAYKRLGNWNAERKLSRENRRWANEVLAFFEIPSDAPLRTVLDRMQKLVASSNRGWALLGSPRRARFSVLAQILASSSEQKVVLKKLHAYHRAQGADSELAFFAGLFRMIDASTREVLNFTYEGETLFPSSTVSLRRDTDPENNQRRTLRFSEKKAKLSLYRFYETGKIGRTEAGIPFSPAYLYAGHGMNLSPETLQWAEALLDFAHSRGQLEELIPVFDFARTLMSLPDERRLLQEEAGGEQHPSPDPGMMVMRLFRYALGELQKKGNVETTREIKDFLNEPTPERRRRLDELWRFNDEAQPELERYFPYPQREIVEYLIGHEGLTFEVDEQIEAKLGAGTSLFDDPGVRESLENKPPSLAWLWDAADEVVKKEATLTADGQAVPPLDFEGVQTAVAQAAREKREPQNRNDMLDTVKRQSQPGMVRIREGIQNARDITREVPEDKRETELARFGGKREVRVRSFLNDKHPDGRLRKITSLEDAVGMTLDTLIKVFFPRGATSKSPAAIIMNALKGTGSPEEKTEAIFKKLVLESERGNGSLRRQAEDVIREIAERAPREEDAAALLVILSKALDPAKKSAGFFGIGNYTIYDDADEVVIRTGIGGKAVRIRLKVVRENIGGQQVITDIEMVDFRSFDDPEGLFKGTLIQHIKFVEEGQRHDADLDDRLMKYLFSKYVGAVSDVDIALYRQTEEDPQPRRLDISIRDQRLPLAQQGAVTALTSSLGIGRLTVDELYIHDPEDQGPDLPSVFQYVPQWGKAWIKAQHINFEARKGTPVTESRGAMAAPAKINRDVAVATMKAMANAYRRGSLSVEGLPAYSEFLKNPQFFFSDPVHDPGILQDAEILNRGDNFPHERWDYYFNDDVLEGGSRGYTAAQKYRALFLLLKVSKGNEEPQSLIEDKEKLLFGKTPGWIQAQYFENPEFQNLFAREIPSLPSVFSPDYSARAALALFSITALLYAENKLIFRNLPAGGFPGMPYSFENYFAPSAVKLEPNEAVRRDLRILREGERVFEIDFEGMKNDPGRLAKFLLEMPGKQGKSIHEVRDDYFREAAQEEGADTRRAAGALSRKYILGRNDSPLIAAFEDFLNEVKQILEDRLEPGEQADFNFYKPFTLSGGASQFYILESFDRFLSGEDPGGRSLFSQLREQLSSAESAETGGLFISALMGLDVESLKRSLSENHAIGRSRAALERLIREKGQEGLAVEYVLKRAETRNAEAQGPAFLNPALEVTISDASRLEVARAAASNVIGLTGTRSELKTQLIESLWPETKPLILNAPTERLRDAIYNSKEKIAVLSVVPEDLDGTDLENYVQGVLAGLSQKELTHEVIVMVEGDPGELQGRFEKTLLQYTRGMDRGRATALNTKIHFVSARSNFVQKVLLSGISKVMLAAPSDFKTGDLDTVQTGRVLVDRLAGGEELFSGSELRGKLGAFVTASFEAALLPVSEISEKDRVLIQNSERQWVVSSRNALEQLGQALGEMLRRAQAVGKAA